MPISTDDIAQRMTAETKEVEKGNTIPMCCVKDTRFILAAKKAYKQRIQFLCLTEKQRTELLTENLHCY